MDIAELVLLLSTATGCFSAVWFRSKHQQLQLLYNRNLADLSKKEEDLKTYLVAKTELEAEHKGLKEKLIEMGSLEKRFTDQFENLSHKIVKQSSDSLKKENSEQIENLIKPYRESLDDFRKEFRTSRELHIRESQDIKNQVVRLADMNKQLSDEANNLTKALRMNPKMRGNWGETLLESLLERSGLVRNLHYRREVSGANDNYNLRADVIIDLPGDRHLIIDSKVSLNAYHDFVSADDKNASEHLKDHLASIRKHIDTLHRKQYDKMYNVNSPDLVFMFVPLEPGLISALQSDPELSNYAFNRNIALVTSSTLFCTLNLVSQIWQRNKQYQNAERIAEEAGKLHTQVIAFLKDLTRIGESLESAKDVYDSARKRLSSGNNNIVRLTQRIEELGAKVKIRDDHTLQGYENELLLEKAS